MLGHPHRVLIVDDDPPVHRTIADMLAGFTVCSAYDGESAVLEIEAAVAQRAEFALVVLDVGMPGCGGLDTLDRIWQLAPDTQVVFCTGTALGHRELRARYGETDAILVIQKPFSHVEMIQATQTMTRKWQLQRDLRSRIGELEAAMSVRTAELEAAERRLTDIIAWRSRLESVLPVSQRLEAVGQLAAGIAHEINNPLQYVGDHLEFVSESAGDLLALIGRLDTSITDHRETPLGGELRSSLDAFDVPYMTRELPGALEAIQGGIQRISAIVRAMKELSHPGTRDARAADVNRALESALEISAAAFRNVADLEKQLAPLPPVTCYISELGQVFLNLIINAAHAMEGRERGRLTVASRRDDEHIVVSITDTGGGIPLDIQPRIFDPFFTTKAVGRGTGQGLAIARAIVVDHHGGSLSFNTIANQGTTFVIRIPIAGPEHRATAAA